MTTQESNKLIAEFMGLTKEQVPSRAEGYLFYNNSWDWLMPVIEKIEKNCPHENKLYRTDGYAIEIHRGFLRIAESNWELKRDFDIIASKPCSGLSDFDTIYELIVEFIQWYNKNKKS